jgi:opacity protein-like surface antigen
MKKNIMGVLVLAVFFLCVSSGFAQTGFFLGIQGGFSAQRPSLKDIEFNTDTTFVYGLRAGVKIWMIAVELNFFRAAHNMELRELFTFAWQGQQVDYNFLGGNIKYFFPLAIFHPYISFGYGYYTADLHEIDKDTDKGYNFGAGIEIHLGKKISILAEGRYHRVRLDIDEQDLRIGDFTFIGGFSLYL